MVFLLAFHITQTGHGGSLQPGPTGTGKTNSKQSLFVLVKGPEKGSLTEHKSFLTIPTVLQQNTTTIQYAVHLTDRTPSVVLAKISGEPNLPLTQSRKVAMLWYFFLGSSGSGVQLEAEPPPHHGINEVE